MGEKIVRNDGESESSPEKLKSYIKVANAGVWVAVVAIIVLLAGVCVWGIFGRLETSVEAVANCEDGKITAYVNGDDYLSVAAGMVIKIDGAEYEIVSVSSQPITVSSENLGDYVIYLGGYSLGETVYTVEAYGGVSSGIYAAQIVIESISPISFLFS